MRHSTRHVVLTVVATNLLVAVVSGQEPESNSGIIVSGKRFVGELASVESDQFSFRASDDGQPSRQVDKNQLVRWSHPLRPKRRPQVLLADGTLLVAKFDWAGSDTISLAQQSLEMQIDALDGATIPRDRVSALILNPPHDPLARKKLTDELRKFDAKEDHVLMTGGDLLVGVVLAIDERQLKLEVDSGEIALPVSRIEAVAFNRLLIDQSTVADEQIVVGLRDGSLLRAVSLTPLGDALQLQLRGGLQLTANTVEEIVFLQSTGGSHLTYLSDLEPVDYRHVPYLNLAWEWRRDRNLSGDWLQVRGRPYLKGISMHSASRLTFQLDDKYRRLEAEVALDDEAGRRGSVSFHVYLATAGSWKEAFSSGIVRGGDAPQPVSVDVTGASALTLVVDFADRGDELDRANWLDARLIR